MVLRRVILLLLGIFYAFGAIAQIRGELTQSRVLILFDESSSMIESWAGGKEKYKAGAELINKLVDSVYAVNSEVEFGLRVFGHQHTVDEHNCYDTKTEVPFSKDNRTQIALRLADIHPLGVTPIAYSLEQAAQYDLVDVAHNVYSIILITDGGESCGGDICTVMARLMKEKVFFRPYIVSLEDYAPLKTAYACMGDYLQVTKERDIPVAVGTIVDAFRPVLKMTTSDYKDMQTVAATAPSVLKVDVPAVKVKADTASIGKAVKTFATDTLLPKKQDTIVFTKPERPPVEKIAAVPLFLKQFTVSPAREIRLSTVEPGPLPGVIADTPVAPPPPVKEHIATLAPLRPGEFAIVLPAAEKMKTREPGLSLPPLVIDTPVTPRTKDDIAAIRPAAIKPFNVIFVIEDRTFLPRQVPPIPPLKLEPVVVETPKPKPPKKPESKSGEFKVETTDAKETTVEIYFTNGKGKFYNSTPQVQLLDPTTNQMVKKFYRTLDADGNPDPQTNIIAGRYDIAFTEARGVVDRNVEIVANKKNKIYVVIKGTSLSFAYKDAPDRPVNEFEATVIERNKAQGRVQVQKCTELLEYEPGNYHVTINTFPQDVRNVDLDFNETEIQIAQPGFAKFMATGAAKSVDLYQRLGDKFLKFYTLDLNDPRSQHLQIQPGEYQAHYLKYPGKPSSAEIVVNFLIKATQETEITIK